MENWQRLMLAAEVRKIAIELRETEALGEQSVSARNGRPFNRFQWDAEHPISGFVPQALDALLEVANIVEPPR